MTIPRITVSERYWKQVVRRDYRQSTPFVWTREVYQNAVDAGATLVAFETGEDEHGPWVTCQDNGSGMEDLGVLLGLGISTKSQEDVGAFGTAKAIILFCWPRWEVYSLDNYLSSEMLDKEPIAKVQPRKGTLVKIWLDGDDTLDDFREVVEEYVSLVNGPKVTLEDRTLKQACRGTLKVSGTWCDVFVNKGESAKYSTLVVRKGGMVMFTRPLYNVPAQVIVDVKGSSWDVFTVSREGLTNTYYWELEVLVKGLMLNPRSATETRECRIEFHRGTGSVIVVREGKADDIVQRHGIGSKSSDVVVGQLDPLRSRVSVEVVDQEAVEVMQEAVALCESGLSSQELYAALRRLTAKKPVTEQALVLAYEQLSEGARQLFNRTVDRLIDDGHSWSGMLPRSRSAFQYEKDWVAKWENGSPPAANLRLGKYQRLLAAWEFVVSKMYRLAEAHGSFTVGFVVGDDDRLAEISQWGGRTFFLLNPKGFKATSPLVELVVMLRDRAAHEVAHLTEPDHSERWSSQYSYLLEASALFIKEWAGIKSQSPIRWLTSYGASTE